MTALINPAPLRVLLAPDAGPSVGGGHVMRCLTLARELKRQGAACRFVLTSSGEDVLRRFSQSEFEWVRITTMAALPTEVARSRPDGLVLDNYVLDPAFEAGLKRHARRVLVMDDLANRPHSADMIADPSYERRAEDYKPFAPHAEIFAGPEFAMVARSFREARSMSSADALRAVDRIFVSFGLSDIGHVADRSVKMLSVLAPAARLEVALAADAPSVRPLATLSARDTRIRLHIDARNVAEIMAACDICVGAGGSSVWERATLGKPTLAVIVAENQRQLIERLTRDGLCVSADLSTADFEARFTAAFHVLEDAERRKTMSEALFRICDGRGAERVADAFNALMQR